MERERITRLLGMWAGLLLALCFACLASPASAETRSLKLYYLHTGERAEITYKRNGKYIDSGLKKINRFLRDWRRNEPTKMDPRLLDLVWEAYKETGSKKHIHVISGYRSPATNNLLRKRGRGVAKRSQHTLGKALDFFIPGVPLKKLRNIGLKKGLGGIGYYPKSGSPFVHMDTGRVRHWPRMSRKELVRVFPKGDTLHVPTDGKPLARYNQAKATYERKIKGRNNIVVAKAEEIEKKPGLFAKLLGRDGEEDGGATAAVAAPKPVRTTVEPAASTTANQQPASKPLGSIPGFETPAEPKPAPEEIPTPATILAALPNNSIPVPLIAPRIIETAQTEATEETITPDISETEISDSFEVAAVLPAKRPTLELAPELPAIPDVDESTPGLSAYQRLEQSRSAALSPSEIEDLRQQVYTNLRTEREESPAIPRPAAPLADGNSPIVIAASRFAPTEAKPITDTFVASEENLGSNPGLIIPQPNPARTVVAALNSEPAQIVTPIEPGVVTRDIAAIPSPNPDRPVIEDSEEVSTAIEETEVAALEDPTVELQPIEPGVSTRDIAGIPLPNPERPIAAETVIVEAEDTVLSNQQVLAGIAVPSPASRQQAEEPVIVTAALDSRPTRNRELVLERFQTPDFEDQPVGKWALASDTTISEIADIQPPAYGRNVIRELPITVLSRGFSRENIDRFTQGFTGSSLEFLDFKRFN